MSVSDFRPVKRFVDLLGDVVGFDKVLAVAAGGFAVLVVGLGVIASTGSDTNWGCPTGTEPIPGTEECGAGAKAQEASQPPTIAEKCATLAVNAYIANIRYGDDRLVDQLAVEGAGAPQSLAYRAGWAFAAIGNSAEYARMTTGPGFRSLTDDQFGDAVYPIALESCMTPGDPDPFAGFRAGSH